MAKPARSASNDTAPAAGPGHNLNPDQRQALLFMHRRRFKALDAEKKRIGAELRNLGKVVKADLGENGLDQIKISIEMESPEGKLRVEARIVAMREAAAWAVGENGQFEMFSDQKPTGETRAFLDGKVAGMDDEPLRNPYGAGTSDHDDYARGWQRGHAVMEELLASRAAAAAELVEGPAHDDGRDLDEDEAA